MCCCGLRGCSLIIGCLEVIFGVASTIGVASVYVMLNDNQIGLKEKIPSPFLIVLFLNFLAGCCLLSRVSEENPTKLLIWINYQIVALILNFLVGIWIAAFYSNFLGLLLFMITRLIFINVVFNHRKDLMGVLLELDKPQVQIATVP